MKVAHLNAKGENQLIIEHLIGTAELSKEFANDFGCGEIGYLCGLMHDIGKYSEEFQRRIHDPLHVKKVDHSSAGAKELCYFSKNYTPLAMVVAGHHSGLLDGGNMKTAKAHDGTFFGRFKKQIPSYDDWKKEISPEKVSKELLIPDFCMEGTNPAFTMSFFIRMIYSCLVDADYLDTEKFMSGMNVGRGNYSAVSELTMRFMNFISTWINNDDFKDEKHERICNERTKILKDCMDKGGQFERGIYTLTVPTGGGKTTASLGFALKQMEKYNMKRVIYVIPYTSIIDQTAKIFTEILGEENVLEHHNGIFYETEDDSQINYGKALATENWDKPVVVTTAVQFFESLYAAASSKCRKLHNIANSVIIFDEAQTLPVPYLKPCVAAMAELAAHYNSTVVLCTATQPAIEGMFKEYLTNYEVTEICNDVEKLYQCFQRTRIVHEGNYDLSELSNHLMENKQVLCIVNQRKTAREIYELIKQDGSYCLTTLIYPADRKQKIREISERLKNGLTCRVIATSLIEAGVDLDFPRVYRQEAGLDSVVQAAGRCNREGKRPIDESLVSIFSLKDREVSYLKQNIAALQWMQKKFEDLGDLQAISGYFNFYRQILGNENLDVKGIIKSFSEGREGNVFPFKTVEKEFHLIEDKTIPVYIPFNEGKELVEQIISGEYDRNTFRRLGQYSVNVFPNHLKVLIESGSIRELDKGVYVLHDLKQYDEDTGLRGDIETGNGVFI